MPLLSSVREIPDEALLIESKTFIKVCNNHSISTLAPIEVMDSEIALSAINIISYSNRSRESTPTTRITV